MKTQEIPYEAIFFVCTNTREGGRLACANPGRCGALLRDKLKEEVAARNLKNRIRVSASGCMNLCEKGPNVMVITNTGERLWHSAVSEEDVPLLLRSYLRNPLKK